MSDYYNPGSSPSTGSFGSSAVMRAEFTAISAGISDKLPPLTGAANKVVVVNASATALTTTTLDKTAIGLGNVDNTSDVNKPVSTAQAAADAAVLSAAAVAAASAAILNPTITEQTLTDAATTNWNMNNGYVANWSIGATGRSLNITNQKVGVTYELHLTLATPSTMTPTYPANWKFQYDIAPDLTTSSNSLLTLKWMPSLSKFWVMVGTGF